MKRLFTGLLALMLVASFAGCGIKEKLEKKAGEMLAEKILGGAGADVDIDGGKMVIKGEDGQEMAIGGTEWPTSDIVKSIPECKDGKITGVMESGEGVFIIIEEVSEKDFEDYLEKIRKDFAEDAYDMKSGDSVTYAAKNAQGVGVTLMYTKGESLTITVSKQEE